MTRERDLFAEAMEGVMGEIEIIGLDQVPAWLADAIIAEAKNRVSLWNLAEEIAHGDSALRARNAIGLT